ncbi:MAG: hypothetical protein WD645_01080 [Dehalococcoidia bacterium]
MEILGSRRFGLSSEKVCQSEIEACLRANGVPYQREARLSDADIVDFVVGTTAIEVKLRGARRRIFSQLQRYAAHERIDSLLLVTNVPMGLPKEINGKPTHVLNLARAWL